MVAFITVPYCTNIFEKLHSYMSKDQFNIKRADRYLQQLKNICWQVTVLATSYPIQLTYILSCTFFVRTESSIFRNTVYYMQDKAVISI
jgi:hypothetical protein